MKKTRWLSVVLALVLVFSLCSSALAAQPNSADSSKRLSTSLLNSQIDAQNHRSDALCKAGDQVRVIVLTKGQPTVENGNFVQRIFNSDSKLMREHSAVKERMDQQEIAYQVNFEYTTLLNGMSLTVDYADLDKIAALPGVSEVVLAREYSMPVLEPKADTASEMIYAGMLYELTGADGSGKTIAVLDTGITADHEAFGVYSGMLQTPAWEKVDMIKAIAELGHGAYYSQKIPYQYDYADGDNDALDDGSSHGSHVAGIAAGYAATEEGEVTFHGSAPDAQILAMKIFGSTEKTTSSDIYFAALEDAFNLGADVINMSIGAPNGFVEDAESVLNDRIYERLENAGVICCISAGNEASMAEYAQNRTGGGYVTTDYPDYGVLGSPASYNGNVAVAAVENAQYPAYMITAGENSFAYRDSNGTALLDKFAGEDLEYVMVPNFGEAEDYADIDVRGKVAVISRGEITFAEKVAYASAAGAVAAVVYDNTEGALVSMAIDNHVIPSVFVEKAAGAALAQLEDKVLHVDSEPTVVQNPEGWGMSSFSSWGPTNDLQIKPTISGVGGNVNSALAGTKDAYEVASGTSMSAPNVSGGYAVLLDAICAANPDLSKAEAAAIARNRTLSHATVLVDYAETDEEGNITAYVPYSPRRQGAGLMDVCAAYDASLVIADPLAELGDDPAKSGVYTITADLENTSDSERTYDVSTDVLTDAPIGSPWGTVYNAMQSALLVEGDDYTISAPETVTLAAGEKKTVTVTITLSDDAKEFLDTYFVNGGYIEGYVYFDYQDAETLASEYAHVTFMGFYGDWAAAPILETHDWRELLSVEIEDPETSENPLDYVEWEINTVPTEAYLVDGQYNPRVYAGDAPFGYPEDGAYSENRIAVSYNTDEAYFTNMLVVPTIIRNARHIVMIARNAETGEIYAVDDTPFCTKTLYDTEEGSFSTYAWFMFDGNDIYSGDEPTPIADDTQVVLEFYANLPYGEDALGAMTPEEIVKDGAEYLQYTIPVVVDGAAPVIENYEYDPETGDVTVTVSDNQFLNAIYFLDENGEELTDMVLFADEEAGESHTVTANVGEQVTFYIAALDYATNESYILASAPHDHEWGEWEVTTEPTCEAEGEQVHACAICGEEESEAIPALGHKLTEVKEVPATCDADGAKAYFECETCGKLFADAEGKTEIEAPEVIPGGHKLTEVKEVPATCEADGVKAYFKCDVCGKLFADAEGKTVLEAPEAISALGHKLTEVKEVPATCEADGVKAHFKCETCGKLFADAEGKTALEAPEVIAKLGHAWDEGKVTKEPTLASEGEKLFTCKNDPSHTRTEVIAKLYDCDGGDNCPSKDFTDVDRSAKSWSHEPIDWAVLKEITNGTTKTTFSPKKTCTRAEAVTFLWRAAGCPEPSDIDNPFADVTLDSWYAKAVLWAVEEGITKGTSATTFSPDNTCIRGQIVTFLWRMQGEPEAKAASTFSDVSAKDYYAPAIDWAVEEGITNGVSATRFAPKDDCTRAHIVTFLFRCLEQ